MKPDGHTGLEKALGVKVKHDIVMATSSLCLLVDLQRDQIGQFLKVLVSKAPCKSSPNILQQFCAIVKKCTFYIKLM